MRAIIILSRIWKVFRAYFLLKIARAGKFNEFDQKNGRSSLSAEYRFFDKKKRGGGKSVVEWLHVLMQKKILRKRISLNSFPLAFVHYNSH